MLEPRSLDKTIIVFTASLLIFVFAFSLVTPAISKKPDKTLPNNEAVDAAVGIDTYWDSKCTQKISSLDWGSLEPGTTKAITMFIKNKGKNQVTLSYYVSNYNPPYAINQLTTTWDYAGQIIGFKDSVQVTFTLSVSETAETIENFSFDIDIIATQ